VSSTALTNNHSLPLAMVHRFDIELATFLGERIAGGYEPFDAAAFVETVRTSDAPGGWPDSIATALRAHLPEYFPEAVEILIRTLGPPIPIERPMDEAYRETPLAYFIAHYGLEEFDVSMRALYEIGKRSYSAHVALREFLVRYPEKTLALLRKWTKDRDPQIRRLVSGATSPRIRLKAMPGITKLTELIKDPRPVLELLNELKSDPSRPVRESVARSLSDILQDNPDIGYAAIDQWLKRAGDRTRETVRAAVRSAAWRGDPRSMALLVGLSHR
jgi:3-methyladenine DNA glycosylase AlkC